jgi:hypothetical protein
VYEFDRNELNKIFNHYLAMQKIKKNNIFQQNIQAVLKNPDSREKHMFPKPKKKQIISL